MVSQLPSTIQTLGQRLNDEAIRLMTVHDPDFGWLGPWQDLVDHLAELPGPVADRFDRIESGYAVVDFHDHVVGGPTVEPGSEAPRGRALPSDVRTQVRRVIGRDVPPLRVHDDPAADALARTHRAEAVTVGHDVYFRQGRFRPHEPEGIGLVAHEATHVAELVTPGSVWRRLTGQGRADEERRADANEHRAKSEGAALNNGATRLARSTWSRQPASFPTGWTSAVASLNTPASSDAFVPLPPDAAAPTTTVGPALQPMRAATDRAEVAAPGVDVDALRRSLFAELKRQLQSEFERGA